MKVFFNGAQLSCISENPVTQRIDECILSQDDIMVSDINYGDYEVQQYLADLDYRNVTVVFTNDPDEYDERPRTNIGKWPYRLLPCKHPEFDLDPLVACVMVEECDEGFFAWDGVDKEVFFGMLVFVGYGKKCSIYNTESRDITVVNTIEGLQAYIMADRNNKNTNDIALFYGDVVDQDVLAGYGDTFGEITDIILKKKGDKLYKNELKKLICKSDATIQKKMELMELLSEKEDIYLELIRKATEWKSSAGNKDELRRVLMNTYEHSFHKARINYLIAYSWIKGADGSNDDVVMYLWERVENDGKYMYIPVGMYADIEEALYYLEVMTSNGGKIEFWERKREPDATVYFDHRITFYTDEVELKGFQLMRKFHINDHDPFEPYSFVRKNDHYMFEGGGAS